MKNSFLKDPDSTLDFAFDWSDWLDTHETVSDHTITAENGITKDSDSESSGVITVWLSGGTAGNKYTVTCRITTSMGRTDERSIFISVKNR